MTKRAVIFDFDGVIANTYRPHFVIELAARHGFSVTPTGRTYLAEHWGMKGAPFLKVCFDLSDEDAQMLCEAWEDFDAEYHVPFIEGTLDTIRTLHEEGYAVSLLTSRGRTSLIPILTKEGLLDRFAHITAHEDTEFHKPDARAFDGILETLAAHGITKEEIVFVGDTKFDLLAGAGAGIDTLIVETGPYRDAHIHTHPHPEHMVIPSATHVLDWLKARRPA